MNSQLFHYIVRTVISNENLVITHFFYHWENTSKFIFTAKQTGKRDSRNYL